MCGVSRIALVACLVSSSGSLPVLAADFTVVSGTTDNTAKSITGTETGLVEAGAVLSVTSTAISWAGPSAAPGVTIDNFGTIQSGNRALDTANSNTPRNLTLNNHAGALITSFDDVFRLNASIGNGAVTINNDGRLSSDTGQVFDFASNTSATGRVEINNNAGGVIQALGNDAIRTGLGTVEINNSGLIDATASASRAINLNTGNLDNVVSFQVFNKAGGVIQSLDDAIRITGSSGLATTAGTFLLDNAGTIQTLGVGSGQALDWRDLNSASATVHIINRATGLITAADNDAVRPGQNAVIENAGRIIAYGQTLSSSAGGVRFSGDAIDFGVNSGTIYNYAGGLISGAKSGTSSDVGGDITVYNYAGATIIGRNGAGVGSGSNATVVNYGTITGAIDNISTRSDGDGIDIDFEGHITNYGLIQGTGARGGDAGNRRNNSEGIAFGGGTVLNYGTISGAGAGIVANNDSNPDNSRSGVAATTLTNYASGLIVGQSSYAIRFENKTGTAIDNDTIVNYGTIIGNGSIPNPNDTVYLMDGVTVDTASAGTLNGVTYTGTGSTRFIRGDGSAIQMGEGQDVLTNHGTIIGNTGRAINLEGGNDTLNIMAGSKIVGLVDGGEATDTLNYNKVGLTEKKRAALQAGQTVNIAGTLYTSFETVNGAARSFASFANTQAGQQVGNIIDNGSTKHGASYETVALLDRVATSSDIGAALNQLSPTAYQAFGRIAIDTAFQTTHLLNQRLDSVRRDGLGFTATGLDVVTAMFDRDNGGIAQAFASAGPNSSAHAAFASLNRKGDDTPAILKAPERRFAGDNEWGLFISGNALFARQGATQNSPSSKYTTAVVTAGIDRLVAPDLIVGFLAGFGRTNADLDLLGSTSKITSVMLGAYGTYFRDSGFLNAAFVYGHNSYDSTRIAVGTPNVSSNTGNQFAAQASVGTDLRWGALVVTPEAGLQYTAVQVGAFTETGAAALSIGKEDVDSLRSSLGVRLRQDWRGGWGAFQPELRAAWQHEFLDDQQKISASFADAALPGSFETVTAGIGRDFGIVGAGFSASIGQQSSVSFNYDYKFGGDDFHAHLIAGRFRYVF
ncbi:autotransporter outer membrane beta-barrel domain-containing protein [Pseudorhodoplanes sinuspersici]|nr:autotransporter outer membrane beta-barrel domain-containing protein [Pseudorhodoplanes sinuspersici]RKE74060.1 outer membrane autotransporter protein [Pseudorhodoplanes sinuspersici]